jgi:hypothetical protein
MFAEGFFDPSSAYLAHFCLLLTRGTQEISSNEQLLQGVPVCGRLHLTLREWHDWQATDARFLSRRVLPEARVLSSEKLPIIKKKAELFLRMS